MVLQFDEAPEWGKAGDLRSQNERLDAYSKAKLFFDRSSLMLRDSFNRSTSISPMESEIRLAARGSVVLKNSLVAGCESIASASCP